LIAKTSLKADSLINAGTVFWIATWPALNELGECQSATPKAASAANDIRRRMAASIAASGKPSRRTRWMSRRISLRLGRRASPMHAAMTG
jgi:hypothetical protein